MQPLEYVYGCLILQTLNIHNVNEATHCNRLREWMADMTSLGQIERRKIVLLWDAPRTWSISYNETPSLEGDSLSVTH